MTNEEHEYVTHEDGGQVILHLSPPRVGRLAARRRRQRPHDVGRRGRDVIGTTVVGLANLQLVVLQQRHLAINGSRR